MKDLLLSQTISVNACKQSLPEKVIVGIKIVRCTIVDSFQGSECDLVISSMCRSVKPGHAEDIRRLNVIGSKAKKGLINHM